MIDARPCKSTELLNISTLVAYNLMLESYRAAPTPCTTMKVVAVPDIQKQERLDSNNLAVTVTFPVEYTEIKHEKVNTY